MKPYDFNPGDVVWIKGEVLPRCGELFIAGDDFSTLFVDGQRVIESNNSIFKSEKQAVMKEIEYLNDLLGINERRLAKIVNAEEEMRMM